MVEFKLLHSLLLPLVFPTSQDNHCHLNTIIYLRQRFYQTGSVKDAVRSGSPKRPMWRPLHNVNSLHNMFKTATSTGIQFSISRQTVLNLLRMYPDPIRGRRPNVGRIFDPRDRNLRLLSTRRNLRCTRVKFPMVLLTKRPVSIWTFSLSCCSVSNPNSVKRDQVLINWYKMYHMTHGIILHRRYAH